MAGRWPAAIAAALIAIATAGLGGLAARASGRTDFELRYFETTETTYAEVVIADGRVRTRYFEDAAGKCERWIEQRPCWTDEDLKLVEAEIAPARLDDLIRLVDGGGFMDLGPSYGDATGGRRYYAIEIAVKLAGRERRVVYQAFPDAAPMPAAFARLRAQLEKIARLAMDRRHAP